MNEANRAAKPLRFLRAVDITGALPPSRVVDAVADAARSLHEQTLSAPPRAHIEANGVTWLTMPVSDESHFSFKLVSVTPANATAGLPVTQALAILADGRTGVPLAILDGAALTAERTAGITGLAIRHLLPSARRLGLVGAGGQAAAQIAYAVAESEVEVGFVYARSPSAFDRLFRAVRERGVTVDLRHCETAADALRQADLVITATTSAAPVLPDDPRLLDGKLLISIGSYRPSMQELPDSAFRLNEKVVVDSPQAISEAGDIINPLRYGLIERDDILDLDVFRRNGSASPFRAIVKSVGHAAYDLHAAKKFYQNSIDKMLGVELSQ